MKKIRIFIAIRYIFISHLFFLITPSYAAHENSIKTNISIHVGAEYIQYEEKLAEQNLDSDATLVNAIIIPEVLFCRRDWYFGFKLAVPVTDNSYNEVWRRDEIVFQTNDLTSNYLRLQGNIGLVGCPLFNPYTGLRWSCNTQKRDNIIYNNEPTDFEAIEKVTALHLMIGSTGVYDLARKTELSYNINYAMPITSEVTNSAFNGWSVDNQNGYGYELTLKLHQAVSENWSVGISLTGGRVFWNGSDWEPYEGGRAIWPENTTDYLTVGVWQILYEF